MPVTGPHRTPKELALIASEVFDRQVRPTLRPEDDDKFVAIDVNTGEYDVDEDDYAAVMRLRNRLPSAEIWLGRIGQPTAFKTGWR